MSFGEFNLSAVTVTFICCVTIMRSSVFQVRSEWPYFVRKSAQ